MRLVDAVTKTPALRGALRTGLGAIKQQDRARIRPEDVHRLRGSIDVDEKLKRSFPTSNRWDYVIGVQHANRKSGDEDVYWVELHSAHDHGATEVLRKIQWLRAWLAGQGLPLAFSGRRKFVWVASGKVSLTRDARRVRELAKHGIAFPTRILEIKATVPSNG